MDQFNQWTDWQKNLNSILGDNFLNSFEGLLQYNYFPLINIYETEKEVFVLASIPGLNDINSVDVYIDYQSIELTGCIDLRYKGFKLVQDELYNGHFKRHIDLPFPVKDEDIDAVYKNGLLIIHLQRLITDENKKQKVTIKKLED